MNSIKWRPILSVFEKSVATYIQAFILALLGSTFFEDLDFSTPRAFAIASIPAAITVLANSLAAANIPVDLPIIVQAVLRVFRSGAAAFMGYLLAIPVFSLDVSIGKAALGAAGVAFLAAVKAEIGKFIGSNHTVGWLPRGVDTPPDDGSVPEREDFDPNDPEAVGDPVLPGEVPSDLDPDDSPEHEVGWGV